jgi:hypothetical protein
MASITVKDKKSLYTGSIRLCISIKVLYLLKTKLIYCLSIVTNSDSLV